MKGPFGKARTDITRKMKMTHRTPAQIFSLKSSSFLGKSSVRCKHMYIDFFLKYYLVNAEYNSNDEIVVNKVIVCGL